VRRDAREKGSLGVTNDSGVLRYVADGVSVPGVRLWIAEAAEPVRHHAAAGREGAVSDSTYAALEEALRAHVADETDGGYLVHWTLAAAAARPDDSDSTEYVYANHDGPPHEWLGLQSMAHRRAMRWQAGDGP
jgi:hypothetical protein